MSNKSKSHEVAELRLALLKENFKFLDFYELLVADPNALCPEIRLAGEDHHAYQKRIDLMIIQAVPFFGGLADTVPQPINSKFLYETQIANINAKDILTLLSPTKTPSEVKSAVLQEMLPRLFHQSAIQEWELVAIHDKQDTTTPPHEPDIGKTEYRPRDGLRLKHYERLLKLDLRQPRADLIDQFTSIIDQSFVTQREIQRFDQRLQEEWAKDPKGPCPPTFAKPWDPNNKRVRTEAYAQLEVWKLRKLKMTFPQIADKLSKTDDWVSKSFYAAYKKTQGTDYKPENISLIKKVRKVELSMTCEDCPSYLSCNGPCPEVLRYADQDQKTYTREYMGLDDQNF